MLIMKATQGEGYQSQLGPDRRLDHMASQAEHAITPSTERSFTTMRHGGLLQ